MVSKVVYSSRSEEWATPDYIFAPLDKEFKFTLDATATKDNTKCKSYWDKAHDGLLKSWPGRVWLNPPYSRKNPFVYKARYEVESGSAELVVCLVPARTDTKWWWDNVMNQHSVSVEVRFVKGRIKFVNAENGAPFPSCLIIYRSVLDDTPLGRGGIRF